MEKDNLCQLKEEPQLSGAYIRSLVKQLSSSRRKGSMQPKDPECVDGDGVPGQILAQFREGVSETPQPQQPQQPQHHKKQVRRRLHTSRPYQERLLNMAEARREIVTALKNHRAAMKQANEKQQQNSEPVQLSPSPFSDQEGKIKSQRNPSICPSGTPNFSNYLDNFSYSSFPHPPPTNFSKWPVCPIPTPPVADNLTLALPNQPLGLNLNFHDFHNLDTNLYHNTNNFSVYSPFSPSSSSSPPIAFPTDEVPSVAISHDLGPAPGSESCGGGDLHPVMDEEMAELRSIGEQYQMEWNDRMNLVRSAWWLKFLRSMKLEPEKVEPEEHDEYRPFDEIMEFPAWLNANENCLQQHFDDCCSPEYFQDPALPCLDIEEIDGMDEDWLA